MIMPSSKIIAANLPEIPVEIEFTKGISHEERMRVVEVLSNLGFKLISRSEIVATVKTDRKTLEGVFQTQVAGEEVRVSGGMHGAVAVRRFSFVQPPQVPAVIRAFVRTVRFPPPIIPLM